LSGDTQLYWGMVLIAVGLLLIVMEALLPSGGVLGLISGVCALAGVVLMWRHSTGWGATGTLVVLILGPTAFFWSVGLLPNTPLGRRLIGAPSDDEAAEKELEEMERVSARRALVGTRGVAVTDLKPSGEIEIDGKGYDARGEQDWIDAGTPVEVVSLGSFDVVVRAV